MWDDVENDWLAHELKEEHYHGCMSHNSYHLQSENTVEAHSGWMGQIHGREKLAELRQSSAHKAMKMREQRRHIKTHRLENGEKKATAAGLVVGIIVAIVAINIAVNVIAMMFGAVESSLGIFA